VTARVSHSVVTESEEQTIDLGRRLAATLRIGDVVTLTGELGSGKTRFTRGIAQALGVDPGAVASPTFVLATRHEGRMPESGAAATLVHIDAYRLRGPEDLPLLGWDRLLDGSSIVIIEWADRIGAEPLAGVEPISVHLEHAGPESRRIGISFPPGRGWSLEKSPAAAPASAHAGESSRPCPTCRTPVDPSSANAPFCCERCRLIDLGKWLGGEYRVSRPMRPSDADESA